MRKHVSQVMELLKIRALIKPAGVSAGLIIFASTALLFSQSIRERSHDVKNGERIYKSGCIACHGATGQGAPETLTEFKRPDTFPDFTRCDQTTPEPNSAWKDVIAHGGPARGFSQIMPAFGELLASDQIDDVIAYLRTLCRNTHWARGELNLPRALLATRRTSFTNSASAFTTRSRWMFRLSFKISQTLSHTPGMAAWETQPWELSARCFRACERDRS